MKIVALAAAVLGLLLLLLGTFLAPVQTARSYWVAWLFWGGISFGAFAMLNLQYLTGGRWSAQLHRPAKAAFSLLPLVALLVLPMLFFLPSIFPWAAPDFWKNHTLPHHQSYLQPGAFWLRAGLYFTLIGMVAWLRKLGPVAVWAGLGLLTYVLCMNFASTDWLMSLEPEWYSTIYGMIFMIAQFLSALALCVATVLLRDAPENLPATTMRDLGNLLLAFVVFWAYLTFSQFLIIWSGNLPREIIWYVHRREGGWPWLALVLALGQFLLPFALLLSRALKQKPRVLGGIAVFILLMNMVHWVWLAVPAWHPEGFALHWLDLAAFLGIGGIWLSAFFWRLERTEGWP